MGAHLNADGTLAVREGASTYEDETTNQLERTLQSQLRSHKYRFPRADVVCAELDVPVKRFGSSQTSKPSQAVPTSSDTAADAAAEPTLAGVGSIKADEPLRTRKLVRRAPCAGTLRLTPSDHLPRRASSPSSEVHPRGPSIALPGARSTSATSCTWRHSRRSVTCPSAACASAWAPTLRAVKWPWRRK